MGRTTLLGTVALLLGQVLFHPAPADVVPRNEVERLVLAREESASRLLEDRLAGQDAQANDRDLLAAGFRQSRREDACTRWTYKRPLGPKLERWASVELCEGRRPAVMRFDGTPGPWVAPKVGEPSVSIPAAPR